MRSLTVESGLLLRAGTLPLQLTLNGQDFDEPGASTIVYHHTPSMLPLVCVGRVSSERASLLLLFCAFILPFAFVLYAYERLDPKAIFLYNIFTLVAN